ncbi:MAG: ABC transporter substrate-binding protein, partial [Anaerolineae bacterium]|nr:ABC transporter substrate-binding protein [Anaerolineae bacterium]
MRIVKRKQIVFTLLALLLVSLVAGCGPAPTPTATPVPGEPTATPAAETPTATPVPEEPTPTPAPVTLTLPGDDWGYPSPFTRYPRGPGYMQMSFLFDTLTWKDEKGVIPWLADGWEDSEGGTKWTFKLHEGVKWHDGEPFTAEDVAFTFEYLKEHIAPWFEALKEQIEKVEVQDEHTVTLYLKQPIVDFLIEVAGAVPIIPKHIWQDVEDPAKFTAEEAIIGSGLFKLVEYNKEEARYVYEANADYFKGSPGVGTLTFIKVENEALALETGTTDYASFWGKEIEAVQAFEDDENYGIIDGPSFWVLQMIFNTQKAPFDDVELRRAVAHAIDREEIVEQVTHGGAIVASLGIISPFTDWHNPNLPVYEYDP